MMKKLLEKHQKENMLENENAVCCTKKMLFAEIEKWCLQWGGGGGGGFEMFKHGSQYTAV